MRLNPTTIDPVPAALCADLQAHGFAALLVGGAVRDLLRGLTPTDWDVATAARPEEVLALFPGSLATGLKYGTITVWREGTKVEVTTFRGEGAYGDGRHPDRVTFGASIQEDLARRDFTVNAMAYDPVTGQLIDPFGGRHDLWRGVLRTVGDPAARFGEDALRMVRFYRFVATLGLRPDAEVARAMQPELLVHVSAERIRDELGKTLLAADPGPGLDGLVISGLMARIVPELLAGRSEQEPYRHDILRHSILTAAVIQPELHLRLAALLHDVGKPVTREAIGGTVHFYGHDEAGAGMAAAILARLRFPGDLSEAVTSLIRLHMFQLPVHPTDAALRRLLYKAGSPARLRDLIELRRADIVATDRGYWRAAGVCLELRERAEAVLAAGDAFSLRELAIDGRDVMRILGIGPGPEVGRVLDSILERVLEDPGLNERKRLEAMVREEVRPSPR